MIDCRISWIFVKVCIRLLLGPVWRGGGGAVSTYDSVSSVTSASGPVVFALGQSCSPPWWGSQPRLVHLSALKWSLLARLSAYVTGKRYGAKHQFSLWERPALDYLPLEGRANLHVVGLLEPLEIPISREKSAPASTTPSKLWESANIKLLSDNPNTFKKDAPSWETFSKPRALLPPPNTWNTF